VPIAVNCTVSPLGTDCAAGVTEIDTRRAAVTVSVVEAETPEVGSAAVMVVVPVESVEARPFDEAAFETDATAVFADDQVTLAVRSCVDAFVYFPVAVNCVVRPRGVEGAVGVMEIDVSSAAVTVSVVEPETPDPAAVALIAVDPTASAVATPAEPDAFETLAIEELDDAHVTEAVRSWVEPSVYVPVAVNWRVRPIGSDGATGVTAIEVSWAGVTVSVAVAEMPDESVALTVADPTPVVVARPFDPAVFETCAIEEADDSQMTLEVRSRVVESV
jgi:hypothetical protein